MGKNKAVEKLIKKMEKPVEVSHRYILAIAAFGYIDVAYDLLDNMTKTNLEGYVKVFSESDEDQLMRSILLDFLDEVRNGIN